MAACRRFEGGIVMGELWDWIRESEVLVYLAGITYVAG